MTGLVYKIMEAAAWKKFQTAEVFGGAPVDVADGFIHLSAVHQVQGTLDKHFAGQTGLVLVGLNPAKLGGDLKWEVSRGGDLFPHLYDIMRLQTVAGCAALTEDAEGRHNAAAALAIISGAGA